MHDKIGASSHNTTPATACFHSCLTCGWLCRETERCLTARTILAGQLARQLAYHAIAISPHQFVQSPCSDLLLGPVAGELTPSSIVNSNIGRNAK